MSQSKVNVLVGIKRKQEHDQKNVNALHVNSSYKKIKNNFEEHFHKCYQI